MTEIKKGSVVKLNSGGMLMTVEYINDGVATVVWFDDKNAMQKQFVELSALEEIR